MARQIYRMSKLNFHLKDSKQRKMHIGGENWHCQTDKRLGKQKPKWQICKGILLKTTQTQIIKYKLNVALKTMALKLFKIILGNFIKIVKLMS